MSTQTFTLGAENIFNSGTGPLFMSTIWRAACLPGLWGNEKENLPAYGLCKKAEGRMQHPFTTPQLLKVLAHKELHQGSPSLSA